VSAIKRALLLVMSLGLLQVPWAESASGPKVIEIHARRFAFTPSEITVKKGEATTLRLVSEDVTHRLLIPDLGINQEISKGHASEVTVTPTNTGDFKGRCGGFCGAGHGSMLFTVHVTD